MGPSEDLSSVNNGFNCQCVREGWRDKLKEQKDEGCQVYGYLEVNKVRMIFIPGGGGKEGDPILATVYRYVLLFWRGMWYIDH